MRGQTIMADGSPVNAFGQPRDYIAPLLHEWAKQYRRGNTDDYVIGPGRVQMPALTASATDVFDGTSQTIWQALCDMPAPCRQVLLPRLLGGGTSREQIKQPGIPSTIYWQLVEMAYYFLAGRLSAAIR